MHIKTKINFSWVYNFFGNNYIMLIYNINYILHTLAVTLLSVLNKVIDWYDKLTIHVKHPYYKYYQSF
jgi:hypothetical protein